MKIVIDIDDNIYTRLFDNGVPIDLTTTINDTEAIATAIRNGTPLPEQQPCEDCISREEAINVVHKYFVKYLKLNDDICLDGIKSLPSVTPKFTDAEIQNMQELEQAQLEKVYEVAYELGKTEIQPCEDCISRSKALEMLGDEPENWTDTEKEIQEVNDYGWFKSILESLPSVTPQQTCEEENLSRFCDDFCRYPREYDEEKEGEYMTEKVCSTCPLGRL